MCLLREAIHMSPDGFWSKAAPNHTRNQLDISRGWLIP